MIPLASPIGKFQSTPSVWRETRAALRRKTPDRNFNPLPPCGGRRILSTSPSWITDFNPLPPCGGRLLCAGGVNMTIYISIHSLRVEGDFLIFLLDRFFSISIHSLRVEGDEITSVMTENQIIFQSTPSVWRETAASASFLLSVSFQSTPSVWRETHIQIFHLVRRKISIHSVRLEGDCRSGIVRLVLNISIHSLRVEGDLGRTGILTQLHRFQSTPSVWRETV